jgi:hypothetical protein
MNGANTLASKYDDDPVTAELLARGVSIAYHQTLHETVTTFIQSSKTTALGSIAELLLVNHYTAHIKIGIAREYLDELKSTLSSKTFDIGTAPALVFYKLLAGFFANLLAAFDNLAQVLNVVYQLSLTEKASISEILTMSFLSRKRLLNGKPIERDTKTARLVQVFTESVTNTSIEKIQRYRNYLTHRRLPMFKTAVAVRVSMLTGRVGPRGRASLRFPQIEKLELLPSEVTDADLDSSDITEICEQSYGWSVDFLGRVCKLVADDFLSLRSERKLDHLFATRLEQRED